MEIIRTSQPLQGRHAVVTVGTYDGIHLGHQEILRRLVKEANNLALPSCVVTFSPHPQQIVAPSFHLKLLTTLEEKAELLAARGVDYLYVLRFGLRFRTLGYEEFVRRILAEGLGAKKVLVGFDHRFGYRRSGQSAQLKELGKKYGFTVEVVNPVFTEGLIVKSSTVRQQLLKGEVKSAAALLGRPYRLAGEVVKGSQRGHRILFPTANLKVAREKLIPADGVYAGDALLKDKSYPAVINIGRRPTFGGRRRVVEVYVMDFEGELYGEILKVDFLDYLREESKFISIGELQHQIEKDVLRAREILGSLLA